MDRPVTSKSRGVCRYYSTPRGCFAGDACKFLHGVGETLTPYDKAKVCRYYAKGHCTRGEKCWFRHVLPRVAPDDERIRFKEEYCGICLEKPVTYGLLTDCNHVFCLECIRQWRAPSGKSGDMISSGMIKSCPLCRVPSRFVVPSAHFFPNSSPRKKETINAYKASMAKVPCKYFDETSRTGKPCCPFGTDCFYQHINPDGTPHVFRHGAKHSMNVFRRYRLSANFRPRFDYDDPIEFFERILDNPLTNLHATLDVIRASLPALMERLASNDEPENLDLDEDEEVMINSFEVREINLDDSEVEAPPPTVAEEVSQQLLPVESPSEHAPPSMQTPHLPETSVVLHPSIVSVGSPSPSQPQPARLSSRFSTVMSAQSRQTFIIDISDDEEDEDEEESIQRTIDASNNVGDSSPLTNLVPRSPPEQQPSVLQPVGNIRPDASSTRPQCEHDVDPPFVTDGRGRVVWSSTRGASGRGAGTEGRALRHSRTGSGSRMACPSPSSNFPVATTRGHAWGGQDTQSVEGKVGDNSDAD